MIYHLIFFLAVWASAYIAYMVDLSKIICIHNFFYFIWKHVEYIYIYIFIYLFISKKIYDPWQSVNHVYWIFAEEFDCVLTKILRDDPLMKCYALFVFLASGFLEIIFQTFLCLFIIRKVGQRKTLSGQRKTFSS